MVTKVTVYSTPTCPFCIKVKDFLKQHKVQFEDVDVSKDRERAMEMVEKSGQMGVPVIEIGQEIIVGFNVDKIKSELGL